jgi:hypothetical protein
MLTAPEPQHLTATELAERKGDGLEVSLWWDRLTGRIWVHVHERSGRSWAVPADPEQALDVFYHPFAYCDVDAGGALSAA